MDYDTLIYLLKEGHIDMPTRIKNGLWPHPPLRLKECVEAISGYLKSNKYFPNPWVSKENGELIDDSAVIEKINVEKFIFQRREASPTNLKKISVKEKKDFNTAESSAEYYLRHILRLPGDLDGWQVIE